MADRMYIYIFLGAFARLLETTCHRMPLLQYNSGVYIQMTMNLNYFCKIGIDTISKIALISCMPPYMTALSFVVNHL